MAMTTQRRLILPILLAASVTGCGWIQPRSSFERDPFVMSHLTKEHDGGLAMDDFEPNGRAYMSRKPTDRATHASDYSWVVGQLRRMGSEGTWTIDYDAPADRDRFGGRLPLESAPNLGFVRDGDRVRIDGEVVAGRSGQPRYRVRSVALLD
jgi:hypothetical protein